MKIWPGAPIYTLLYDPAAMGPDFADAEYPHQRLAAFTWSDQALQGLVAE
ncbi:MAG: hypothetical protein WKG07_23905 [Hymenobacter sp.]